MAERMTRLHVKLLDGKTLSIEVDCATQTADGVLATIVDAARAADRGGPQSIGSQQPGGPPTAVGAGMRLVLAGRHIAGDQPLAAFNVDQQSELHIVLRQAPDPHAELRAALATPACGLLSGYEGFVKVGGRDIMSAGAGAGGYSQHGACSYVYKGRRRGDATGELLAIKVMLNYSHDSNQSTAIRNQFSAEHDLLTNHRR